MTRNINNCHTILIAKKGNEYYKIDYTNVKCFDSIEEIVEDIKSKHSDFINYNLVKFDTNYFIVNNF